ncbi:ras GEF [Sparassis crispa]|uniref:Ras GEF n=1 Tax=Sparassis crispa TaxID=139825 RepID=A0A401GRQ0_9APHY|nr:ras GEF [Sparassis crispa]GBE84886.1 ras GEF [Sparassis crispa]
MISAAYGGRQTVLASTTEQQPAAEEQYISTFFCRALYDYQTSDASSLSFRKNDIIEVLTRLESGWWDGLLGDERGWFPSNYVTVISDQEAEAALNGSEFSTAQPALADESTVDMAHSMSQALSQSDRDGDWLHDEFEYSTQGHTANGHSNGNPTQPSDFWVPQVSQDGRIFYVNTQTGQHARDLPQEAEEDPDGDLAGLTAQPSSRAGTSTGMNAVNGTDPVSWTLPVSNAPPAYNDGTPNSQVNAGRMRSDSSLSRTRDRSNSAAGFSIHSDDSEVQPAWRDRSESSASAKNDANGLSLSNPSTGIQQPPNQLELTPPEQFARSLQQALTPPSPESPPELSNQVREATAAVMEYLQSVVAPRRTQQFRQIDERVLKVVTTVRNLLYVTATPSGHIPTHLYPRDGHDNKPTIGGQTLQTHLKAAHRKVAGTLSKLVLSALAMQYDPGVSTSDRPNRMEADVAELERAVVAFVVEVQYFQDQITVEQKHSKPITKRLYGVFSTANVGLGLPGAGTAASWKGFGYVPPGEGEELQLLNFTAESVLEMKSAVRFISERLGSIPTALKRSELDRDGCRRESQYIIAHLSSTLDVVGSLNVAHHVDIDGVRMELAQSPVQIQYMQTVERARLLVRTMEASVQSLYDDGASFLMAAQSGHAPHYSQNPSAYLDYLDALTAALMMNANVVIQSLDALLAVGFDQSNIGQGDYNTSIEWRRRRSCIKPTDDVSEEDIVGVGLALSKIGFRSVGPLSTTQTEQRTFYNASQPSETSLDSSDRSRSDDTGEPVTPTWHEPSESSTLVQYPPAGKPISSMDDDPVRFIDEDPASSTKSPPRTGGSKIIKVLGPETPQHYVDKMNADAKPWYLRPTYDQSEILVDPEGGVRAGTPSALVERLTAHELGDPTFNQNFLMTFKSFITIDELFDLLVQRFWIQAPPGLAPPELEEWTKLKQHVIRVRVLNTFKTMVTDDGILEKEDMYILTRMKEFASDEEVVNFAAARQLLILIERAQRGGDGPIKTTHVPLAPPAPIMPRNSKRIELLDIDPLELARQLTLMEAALYKKIRPMECLQRSRESKPGKNPDNITSMIQLANRMANWVAESVLSREDSKRRAAVVKHFISVADRCRAMQNFSTMTAIISGLNTPPIRRLKRTWEHVQARAMSQLRSCETTIDSAKNFNNYRSLLARITPPCVPFIGVYLTTLTFINDGAEDKLGGNMINFRKRQKAAEVIQDIKRWQSKPYNLQTLPLVVSYLEDSFRQYADGIDYGDQFWNLSLEREPREREDEKMARLLQESGFL